MFEDDSMDYQGMDEYTQDYDQMDSEDSFDRENQFEGYRRDKRECYPLYYKCYPVYGYEQRKPRYERPKCNCGHNEFYPPMKCKCHPDWYGRDKKQCNWGWHKKCGFFGGWQYK